MQTLVVVVVFFISSLYSSAFASYVETSKSLITRLESRQIAFNRMFMPKLKHVASTENGNSRQVQPDTKHAISGFTIELIHRDSLLSPFYNPSKSQSEHITNAAIRSNSRTKQLALSLLQNKFESHESIIIPNHGSYLMRIYIGTPPVERLAIAETASDLTWVQCSPCLKCFQQDTPLYNKTNSSTFTNVSCLSQPCTLLPPTQKSCGPSKQCFYSYKYNDQSFTVGELVTDSIRFGSNNTEILNPITFGCGYYNKFTHDSSGRTTGVIGLGAGPLSLVSQLSDSISRKFSYCLLPFASNTTSKMKFGNESTISQNGVVSTPIINKSSSPTFYFLNLEGITIGEKRVESGHSDKGNIIIDSGTALSYLEPSFYNDIVTSLKELLGVEVVEEKDVPYPFNFCFAHQEGMSFPDLVFHFTGANISLGRKNLLFLLDNNLVCLAMVPSNHNGLSIFGNVAQTNFQVEYDVGGGKVSFAPMDCTKY